MKSATEDRKYIHELHFEHMLWTNELKFFKDEIKIFESRLEEVAQRNTKIEATAPLEHLQNQYIREKEVIDQLMHDINLHEQRLVQESKDHPIAIDHRYFQDHTGLRDRMETFHKIYQELKVELMNYLRKWM